MSIRLKELVEILGGKIIGDPEITVSGIASLSDAIPSQITFLSKPKFRLQAMRSQAAAIILSEDDNAIIGSSFQGARIIVPDPYAYFAHLAIAKYLLLNHPWVNNQYR